MSMTQTPTTALADTARALKAAAPKSKKAAKPTSTPGGIPAAPAMAIGAATTTAAIGALGAATGGIGVAVLAGAGAIAAGTGAARAIRKGATSGVKTTRTITKTSTGGPSGSRRTGGAGGGLLGKGRSGSRIGSSSTGRRGTGASAGKRTSTAAGAAAKARKAAAGVAAARAARPASPTERRVQQTAARRARGDAARAQRRQAAAQKRVATARKGAGMKSGMKSAGKSGRAGTGRRSPHSKMATAHKRNQRANTGAQKAAARRTQRRNAADKRRRDAVLSARHRRRAGGAKKPTQSVERRQALARKRTQKRRNAAMWGATIASAALVTKRGRRAGAGIRDTYRDTLTHALGGAALLEGIEKARLFNEVNGIENIPDVPDTLVHTGTPLAVTGPRSAEVDRMNPFNLLPEAEDMLNKIQSAELGGALPVVYAFDDLPEAVKAMSDSYIVLANRSAAEMPFHPEVGAALEQVHRAFAQAIKAAEEVGPLTRRLHAADIERLENQRQNEQAWDVVANQG